MVKSVLLINVVVAAYTIQNSYFGVSGVLIIY
jgi:hypothetical protein